MKNLILVATFGLFLIPTISSCSNAGNEKELKAEASFVCPMHPEVTGAKGDKCAKCGMDLVEKQ